MRKTDIKSLLAGTVSISSAAEVESTLYAVISRLFELVLVVGVAMIIWSAYNFLASGGDEQKVEKSKKILLYSVIAIVVAILATSLPPLINNLLGGK